MLSIKTVCHFMTSIRGNFKIIAKLQQQVCLELEYLGLRVRLCLDIKQKQDLRRVLQLDDQNRSPTRIKAKQNIKTIQVD